MSKNPFKVVFAEGCFDELAGSGLSQEEIDEIKAKIEAMAESGELAERSEPIEDIDDLERVAEALARKPETRQ